MGLESLPFIIFEKKKKRKNYAGERNNIFFNKGNGNRFEICN